MPATMEHFNIQIGSVAFICRCPFLVLELAISLVHRYAGIPLYYIVLYLRLCTFLTIYSLI